MDKLKISLQNIEKNINTNVNYKKIISKTCKKCSINDIKEYINSELEIKKANKKYINILKIILININKVNNNIRDKKEIEEYMHVLMNKYIFNQFIENPENNENSKEDNEKIENKENNNNFICKEIFNLYKEYLSVDNKLLNNILEHNFIKRTSNIENENNYFELWKKINMKNGSHNNMTKIINSFTQFPNILYLTNKFLLEEEDEILTFVKNIGYEYKENDIYNKLKLKRGFIKILEKNNESYLLKFQPNKSFIEIIMNKYLSKYNQFKNLILFPEYIFINKNNSYFYVIQKYNCDLLKFIKISPFINIHSIFKIIHFITHIVFLMHNIDIIYGDVKLENIVINHDNFNITDMKLIDFDVSLFDTIPNEFKNFDDKILNLLKNKKPRGTKIYMSKNKYMEKSNDIYSIGVFIIILLYKNIFKLFNENDNIVSEHLKSKIIKKLNYFKNNIDNDDSKKKLMKYIFRIFNDKRFNHLWKHKISIKKLYTIVKDCIDQNIDAKQLYHQINYL